MYWLITSVVLELIGLAVYLGVGAWMAWIYFRTPDGPQVWRRKLNSKAAMLIYTFFFCTLLGGLFGVISLL